MNTAMNTPMQIELEKLTAWTANGMYLRAQSTSETELWNALVERGLVERTILSNLNHYRIIR